MRILDPWGSSECREKLQVWKVGQQIETKARTREEVELAVKKEKNYRRGVDRLDVLGQNGWKRKEQFEQKTPRDAITALERESTRFHREPFPSKLLPLFHSQDNIKQEIRRTVGLRKRTNRPDSETTADRGKIKFTAHHTIHDFSIGCQ